MKLKQSLMAAGVAALLCVVAGTVEAQPGGGGGGNGGGGVWRSLRRSARVKDYTDNKKNDNNKEENDGIFCFHEDELIISRVTFPTSP
jgi:hypothetical protein